MLYYRYRAPIESNFKELLYDEMYFASPSECNDPFDSKTYFEFTCDKDKWKNLLTLSWRGSKNLPKTIDLDAAADALSNKCPLPYDFALSVDFHMLLVDVFIRSSKPNIPPSAILLEALQRVLGTINRYKTPTSYFVSFSKSNDEILMWSHYSAKHEGYCLIFKSIDGRLKQCPTRSKHMIRRVTPDGLAPSLSYGIPESFPFQDIEYVPEVKPLNAFNCFPSSVSGYVPSEEIRLHDNLDQFGQYLQKHISWGYEKESRLVMIQPEAWALGEHIDYSVQERLLHYEPTQLVGIILGARISEHNKTRLIEIVKEHQEKIARSSDYKRVIFDFVIFEAKLAHGTREMKINPIEILSLTLSFKPNDQAFSRRYSDWENGFGLCFDGNTGSKVCIKS